MRFLNAMRWLAIVAMLFGGLAMSGTASAQVAVEFSVGFAPPELPVYEQPICPGDGYIWTPGYWAWDDDDQDYYWVPGTWVEAPEVGYLWTPGYWGWGGDAYAFHVGYWGPVVGFYGGIDYGWGYTGRGYYGGRWDGGHFYYNRAVNNVNVTVIHNVYETRVENNVNVTRVSYNGGNGGVNVRATAQEEAASRERHIGPVATQNQHVQAARGNPELRASANRGKPPIAATARPAAFTGGGVVPAKAGGNYNPPANRGGNNASRGGNAANRPANESRPANENNRPANNAAGNNNANRPPNTANHTETNTNRAETNNRPTYNHANELPKHSAPPAEANGNQKYQQQQEKLAQKQQQDHQKLQQRQDQEHQRMTQQQAPPQRQQQIEQRHQQQTQQLEQKHQQQTQQMQQRQQPKQQAPPPRQNDQKKPNQKP